MGPSEKEICIKYDKGGEVLACADSCCPIAVHVRQSIAKFHQAKEHVLTKKQALHTFIDKEMIDNVREVPSICERDDEPLPEKKSDVPETNCDQQGVVGKQIHCDPSLQQHLHGKRRAETGDLTCGESRPVSTQRACGKQVNKVKDEQLTDSPRRLTRTSASLLETSNAAGELVQVKQPYMLLPVILPNGKRRRVLWRRKEEEMIEVHFHESLFYRNARKEFKNSQAQ
ncbi:hypothetical protein RND71_012895 [Anisodus tanguticus]|uniref:Uncharacterized protein n=1 Tax=Anisodus tanguticus TaxID=243964 RepID=A0AAE1SE34_9SOLA|nr:hypothetical protein RND71_012895 [Anisodus tanguticus]